MAGLKKILIVEDEKPIAKAMELKLNNSGFNAKAVGNGEEALTTMESESFDLLIVDLVMPKMDGFGLLEALKEKGNIVPVIVSSNLSQDEDFEKAKEMGAIDYFIKSNTPISKIVEYVQRILK